MPDDAGPLRKIANGGSEGRGLGSCDNDDAGTTTQKVGSGVTELSEVVGDSSLIGRTLCTGDILPLIDMAAGRCAALHVRGQNVVTGSFDSIRTYGRVEHGDIVKACAEIVSVGSRSMLICVEAWRECRVMTALDGSKEMPRLVLRAFTTFVVTSKDAEVARINRADSDDMDALAARFKTMRKLLELDAVSAKKVVAEHGSKAMEQLGQIPRSDLGQTMRKERTTVRLRQQFLPRNLNYAGIVFGGDILKTLERAATTAAGRLFGPDARPYTQYVRQLVFIRPVLSKQLMDVRATVVATWSSCACVMVRANVEDPFSNTVLPCHSGVFFVTADRNSDSNDGDSDRNVRVHVEYPLSEIGNSVKRARVDDTSQHKDFFIAMAVASDLDVNTLCEDV